MKQRSVEVVVAHYNEDLSWLKGTEAKYMIYTKGDSVSQNADRVSLPLPNIGREGHTYLHHIVTHYHDLDEVTLFVQGRINDHVCESIQELVAQASRLRDHEILTCSSRELKLFDAWDGMHCDLLPGASSSTRKVLEAAQRPGDYFKHFFGHGRLPLSIGFNPAAIFGVPRELIHRHPQSFYQELLETMFLGEMAHNDPETGHMMEAFWLAMWKPEEYVCWDESQVSVTAQTETGRLAKGRWERGRHCIREGVAVKAAVPRADSPLSVA